MQIIIELPGCQLQQMARLYDAFIAIVIVKLNQIIIIFNYRNGLLSKFRIIGWNPANKDEIWQINIFGITESQRFLSS
jgi:hypothetical protein